ncbi:MAG: hypothetical protein ABEN55_00490 [Bradymonadaceae bacterium]
MPRSASTSLAEATARLIADVPDSDGRTFKHERPPPPSSDYLPSPTGQEVPVRPTAFQVIAGTGAGHEMRNLPHEMLFKWANARFDVYRQHVVPTDHNVASLRDYTGRRIVVLTRHPRGVVQSFRRRVEADMAGVPHFFPGHTHDMLESRSHDVALWKRTAKNYGITEAFRKYRERWVDLVCDFPNWFAHLTYCEIRDEPRRAVQKAARALTGDRELSLPEDFELPRLRYTRDKV